MVISAYNIYPFVKYTRSIYPMVSANVPSTTKSVGFLFIFMWLRKSYFTISTSCEAQEVHTEDIPKNVHNYSGLN